MASQAEVDLVISTADALPELERDLSRIIRVAEDGAESIDLEAGFEVQRTIAGLEGQLNTIINAAENDADPVELQAAIDRSLSLNEINRSLSGIIRSAEAGASPVEIRAELDEIASALRLELQVADVVREVEASAPEIDIQVDVDRSGRGARSVSGLGKALSGLLGPLAKVGATIGTVSLAGSQLAPVLAAVAGAVQQIAPASAVAVTGMLTVALTAGTVKLAMLGVGDAVKAAFDPSTKPEELDQALKNLAPSARSFVKELSGMRKELKAVQQATQQNFFQNFDGALRLLSKNVLPEFKGAIGNTATTLNTMALGAAQAASDLGKDGTLGRALQSSVRGLENLIPLPNLVVTGLGQLAAAAGPAFERLTAGAARAASSIAQDLTNAFEEGRLESAIDGAIDAVKQLGTVFGNIFEGLGNIMEGFQSQGEGLFGTLEKISQAFAEVTASRGFQEALRALTDTMSVLVSTVLPLISQALQALGPVFTVLAEPVQALIRILGKNLSKIITALGPVLVSLAGAFGKLVQAVTPIINLLGTLIAAVLPLLIPLFDALGQVFEAITPFIQQLAKNFEDQLVPILTTLATQVLPQILPPLVELGTKIFPILTDIITRLSPTLTQLATTFAQLLVALVPVIVQVAALTAQLLDSLMPVIGPLITVLVKLIEVGLKVLSGFITSVLIPTLGILVDLLNGNFRGAFEKTKDLVKNVAAQARDAIFEFVRSGVESFQNLARQAGDKAREMANQVVARVREMASNALADIRGLPDRARDALGNAGSILVNAGADLVRGFINGIKSQISNLVSTAAHMAESAKNAVTGFLDSHSPSRVMMGVGEDTADGFRLGIANGIPELRRQVQEMASIVPSFALPDGVQPLANFQAPAAEPVIQVFLGNELLNTHVDARITESNQARDRVFIRGVRR